MLDRYRQKIRNITNFNEGGRTRRYLHLDKVRLKITFCSFVTARVSFSLHPVFYNPSTTNITSTTLCIVYTLIGVYQRNARSKSFVRVSGCAWSCVCLRTCVFGVLKRMKAPSSRKSWLRARP